LAYASNWRPGDLETTIFSMSGPPELVRIRHHR